MDNQALIIAPSAVGLDSRVAWPATFLSAMRVQLDVANFHLYHLGQAPEVMIGPVAQLKAAMSRHGLSQMPLWNTETGYLVPNDTVTWDAKEQQQQISDDVAALYVPRAMLISRALGFERFFWYAWDNKKMGFVDLKTGALRPQALVLSQFMSLLAGSRLHQCAKDEVGVWRCDLTLETGRRGLTVWMDPSAKPGRRISVPYKVATIYRLDGVHKGDRSSNEMSVDSLVSLVVEQ
ncbi:MAG: hypothetical protein K2X00_20745 [Nitrospiraceae bacterium]|nr:hypothetical protein [Nitrospiraceae bacterium]